MIDVDLAAFLQSGLSMVVGTRDARLVPEVARAVGLRVEPGGDEVTVFVPVATGADTRANLGDNGRIAVTCSRPMDHRSIQLKGSLVAITTGDEADRADVERYRRTLTEVLGYVGVPPRLTLRVQAWPCHAVRFRVEALFQQTPGPDAGTAIGPRRLAPPPAPAADVPPASPATSAATLPLSIRLADLAPCFQGIAPALIATCDRAGEPNITYLSQVFYVDPGHVALSRQFFNKTQRNIAENPYATIQLYDPRTFEAYRFRLRFDHAETSGALFDQLSARIQVIASHTGMAGIFRLLSADVHEVLEVTTLVGYLTPPDPAFEAELAGVEVPGPLTELRGLQAVSARIARAEDLDGLLSAALGALDEVFGFGHAMVLVPDESGARLVTIASHGYGEQGIGAEVAIGQGLVGTVAERRRMIRIAAVGDELRYGRAVRGRLEAAHGKCGLAPEVPLPGLPHAQAQLGLPLLAGDELVGVLAVESPDPLAFDEWDEAFLQIVANQIAMGIDAMQEDEDSVGAGQLPRDVPAEAPPTASCELVYYRGEDVVFADGEYLVRGVPAKILWKVLRQRLNEGRTEFLNRELRLDPSLGLPGYKDNLESRLILLRKRLEAKCPALRMVPVRRGRFALEVTGSVALEERDATA